MRGVKELQQGKGPGTREGGREGGVEGGVVEKDGNECCAGKGPKNGPRATPPPRPRPPLYEHGQAEAKLTLAYPVIRPGGWHVCV